MEIDKKTYDKYVKEITPTHNFWLSLLKAFFVGGLICLFGQWLNNMFAGYGLEKKEAGTWTLIVLILTSVILTGFNIFPRIVKFGGAGALVPITGFANSVIAPAIEYKAEGQIFGIGCKIFIIAGPVILYGILSSWGLGILYYILKSLGIMG